MDFQWKRTISMLVMKSSTNERVPFFQAFEMLALIHMNLTIQLDAFPANTFGRKISQQHNLVVAAATQSFAAATRVKKSV